MCVFKLFITFCCSRQTLAFADRFRHRNYKLFQLNLKTPLNLFSPNFKSAKAQQWFWTTCFLSQHPIRLLAFLTLPDPHKYKKKTAMLMRKSWGKQKSSFLINIFGWNLLSFRSECWLATWEGEKLQPQVNYMCCAHVGVKKMSAGRLINCTN